MRRIFPKKITVQACFWLYLICALIIFPIDYVIAWILTVCIHELGHLLGLWMFRLTIYEISIKCFGVYISTSLVDNNQEIVIAGLGPIVGLIPVLFSRWMPSLAICSVMLFCFNMLPFEGFDGGRILRCILRYILPGVWINRCINLLQYAVVLVIGALGLYLKWITLVAFSAVMLILRTNNATFPCKHKEQIVQWSK